MAITSKANGSTAMSTGSDVTLGSAITDAGVYQLQFDVDPIVDGETLILIVETKVLTGGSAKQVDRVVVARNDMGTKVVVTDIPRASLYSLTYKLRQEGGSNRTIDWNVTQLQ